MSGAHRFLVVETFRLGDLVYLTSFLAGLRDAFPRAEIHVLTSRHGASFPFPAALDIQSHALSVPWEERGWARTPARSLVRLWRATRGLRGRFESFVSLDPRGDIRHRLLINLIRTEWLISFDSGVPEIFNSRFGPKEHILASRQKFLEQVTAELGGLSGRRVAWPWAPAAVESAPRNEDLILLAPEASHAIKQWPALSWLALNEQLHLRGWRTCLVVRNGDSVREEDWNRFDEVFRGDIRELEKQVRSARCVVCLDSFPGHLAAALGSPVVSIFGPSDPMRWAPSGPRCRVVLEADVPCRPCGLDRCNRPAGNCMNFVTVPQVLEAVEDTAGRDRG